jgi:Cof subfamily protein (haloacid dehalogenase superfamily)
VIRLAAIDLDGTLLRSDGSISDRSRHAIAAARCAGMRVVIVTARSPRTAAPLAVSAGADELVICANGATVWDVSEGRVVAHRPLAAATAHRLVRELRVRLPGVVFGWEDELRFGSEPAYEALRQDNWWPRPENAHDPVDPLAWPRPMTKLLARLPERDLDGVFAVVVDVAGAEASVTLAGDAFVEIAAPDVSKGTALAMLAGDLGVDRHGVAAFGDHLTDLGMVEWAELGVAVANAHPRVLSVADEVTAANDDDGVAVVLERLVVGYPSSRESVGA